jgi:hypothetical protein
MRICELDSYGRQQGSVTGSFECGNEFSGCITCVIFFGRLSVNFSRRVLLHGVTYLSCLSSGPSFRAQLLVRYMKCKRDKWHLPPWAGNNLLIGGAYKMSRSISGGSRHTKHDTLQITIAGSLRKIAKKCNRGRFRTSISSPINS